MPLASALSPSPLEMECLRRDIPLPLLLKEITRIRCTPEKRLATREALASRFPHTAHQPLLRLHRGEEPTRMPAKRVGVVFSGGQAPGGHNVIAGLFDALKQLNPESQLVGFLNGPAGLLKNQSRLLDRECISHYRNLGGFDLLGSGRTKIDTEAQFELTLQHVRTAQLEGLVIIGGDDSNTNAALLAEYFLAKGAVTQVIGVPKTIDGDLKNAYVEVSFGFDTACKVYSEMIGNICRDVLSAKKYTHFIKLMGRSASHVTLECALQTHPNVALIGEEIAHNKWTLKQIAESIGHLMIQRAEKARPYGVILIPEGLVEFVPEVRQLISELNTHLASSHEPTNPLEKLSKEAMTTFHSLPAAIRDQLLLERDPHGNVQLSSIATEQLLITLVKEQLAQASTKVPFHPVGHFFGYEGRSGFPSLFDASYCYALGFTAAALLASGCTGYMAVVNRLASSLEEWQALGLPLTHLLVLEERGGKEKPVIQKALVALDSGSFQYFATQRQLWGFEDHYRYPGPLQLSGERVSSPAFATTISLALEHEAS